jgi:hypothetical protein
MDATGFELLVRLVRIAGVALAACGLFLIFLDVGHGPDSSSLRRRLSSMWRQLGAIPFVDVPGFAVGAAVRGIDRFVEQSERNVATAGAFTLIVFIAIPIAALLNWFRGGSAQLLIIMLSCAVCVAILAILSEMKRQIRLMQFLSIIVFVAVFLFIPGYVFVSLTERILIMPIGHGALAGILIAPLLYLICHSVILLGAGARAAPVASIQATPLRRIATLSVAFVPFAYIGAFLALVMRHLKEPDLPVPSTWWILILLVVCSSLAAAMTVYFTDPPPRHRPPRPGMVLRLGFGACVATVLAILVGILGGESLQGSLAPVLVPLVMPIILAGIAAMALLAKVVLGFAQFAAQGEPASERPYRIVGILALILAAGAGWASATL